MTDLKYLQQRRRRWYVVVEIPAPLRTFLGRPRFVRSLGTESLSVAQERRHKHVAQFKAIIADATRSKVDPGHSLIARARELRHELESAGDEPVIGLEGERTTRHRLVRELILDEAMEVKDFQGEAKADLFYAVATGEDDFVRDAYERWLKERKGQTTKHTEGQNRAVIEDFLSWAGERTTIKQVTRRMAGAYIERHLLGAKGLTRKTVARYLSALSPLWRWLIARGYTNENPWRDQELGEKRPTGEPKKAAWPWAKLRVLLTGDYTPENHDRLHDLMRLALVTGCRLNELCSLRLEDVLKREDGWWFKIVEGKTAAAQRDIPVHDLVASIVERRLSETGDGFLFAGLKPGGPDGKRSWYVSKAFGFYSRRVEAWSPQHDFHSFRRTFSEVLLAQGVPEPAVAVLMGHALQGMTFGVYGKGDLLDKRSVINRLEFPEDVRRMIAEPPIRGNARVVLRRRKRTTK